MKRILCLLILAILASGCGTPSVYREVFRDGPDQYNSRTFPYSQEIVYTALLKALYSRKFTVENENKDSGDLLAKRSFQKGKRTIALILQAKFIADSENKTTLFLTAMEISERLYVADRTRFLLFIIPLPGGGGKEATKIKEQEKLIEDRDFYQQLFEAIEGEIATETKEIVIPAINPALEILEYE